MSSFEMAHQIVNQMNDEQLQGFILLFGGLVRSTKDFLLEEKSSAFEQERLDLEERKKAFETLEKLCRHIPDIDEKKELEEYRTQRYGI